MTSPSACDSRPRPRQKTLLGLLFLLPGVVALVVAMVGWSCFRLHGDSAALRHGLLNGPLPGWQRCFELNLGTGPVGLVQLLSHALDLPSEGRRALAALHRAEVGMYQPAHGATRPPVHRTLEEADRAMAARRWERMVTVAHGPTLVLVYAPIELPDATRARFMVVLLEDSRMVLASATGNLRVLFEEIRKQAGRQESLAWLDSSKS